MSPETALERAPAKVNLGLEVRGRREDGYHDLDTTLLAVDLADELEVVLHAEAGEDTIELTGPCLTPDVPADDRNLALRAVELVRAEARAQGCERAERRLTIRLAKHVPSGAGLGGGSSDAAAALRAATRLFGIELAEDRALALLATLGSDCPFFHAARATGLARCRGRGEIVTPLARPRVPWWIALVTPAVSCSTAAVYAAFVPLDAHDELRFDLARAAGSTDVHDARAALVNDLEAAALVAVPALVTWRAVLDDAGAAHFRLAGSGSSFFGFFENERRAEAALGEIAMRATARDLGLRGRWCSRASPLA